MSDRTDKKLTPEPRKRKAPKTAFKPGVDWTGNAAGRPKGIKNLIQRDYLMAMQADFMQFGVDAIVKMREKNPGRYIEAIGRLMPQEHSWDEEQAESFVEVLKYLGRASRSKDE